MTKLKQIFAEVWAALRKDGSFAQSYAIVLSGTGVNILAQLIITPIITRIYGPEAYGSYSIFNALSTNIALVATLRFPQALMLPSQERDFHILMRVTLLSALLTTLITFVALFSAAHPMLKLFGAERLADYYFLIPLMVFLIALNQVFGQWQYRLDKFKKSVAIDTGILVGVRVFNLGYGWLTTGNTFGLILGDMLGKIIGLLLSAWLILKDNFMSLFARISWKEMLRIAKEYKQYPLYNLPGVWITLFSDQFVIFFISSQFGLKTLGVLSLAISMLDLPKRLFAYTVTSVFFKKAVEEYKQSLQALQQLVLRTMYLLLLASVIPYSIVIVFGPELFSFVFGEEWFFSGRLAQYISVYCVFELLYISLDSVYYVLRKEKRLFGFQVATFGLRLIIILSAIYLGLSLEQSIAALTIANALLFLSHLGYILYLLKLNWLKHLSFMILIELAFVGIVFGFRYLI